MDLGVRFLLVVGGGGGVVAVLLVFLLLKRGRARERERAAVSAIERGKL